MILVYLANEGKLPWTEIDDLDIPEEKKFRKISKLKEATSIEDLCKNHPPVFAEYLNYVRNLEFDQDPDYRHCKSIFSNYVISAGLEPLV